MLVATRHVVFARPVQCLLARNGGWWRPALVQAGRWRILRTEVERGVGCTQENIVMRAVCPDCCEGKCPCGSCGGTGNLYPHGLRDPECGCCLGRGDLRCWTCHGTGEIEVEAELEVTEYRALVADGAIVEDTTDAD